MGNCFIRMFQECCSCTKKIWCFGGCDCFKRKITRVKVHRITKQESWDQTLTEANKKGKILVANFSMSWCRPCLMIEEIYSELADAYPSIIFVTVDVDELDELSNEWDVEATPTIFFLEDGRQVDKLVGANEVELQKKTAAAANLARKRK